MKKLVLLTMMLFAFVGFAVAQQKAEIKFDKVTHNFGRFIYTNGTTEITRIYVEGIMEEAK